MARHADIPRVVVTCRLERRLVEKLDKLAETANRSRSELIEQAVRKLCDGKARKPKKK